MRRQIFNEYIESRQFRELFIMEMGWNNVHGQTSLVPCTIDVKEIRITAIAERSGFQVLTCEVEEIPSSSFCKKLDLKLRRQAESYILIFFQPQGLHHLWVAPVKKTEKRDLVFIEYSTIAQADFLFSKIDGLSFDVDEGTTIMDVKERIQATFVVNSEKLTKDFYQGFRKQHSSFVTFISGIDDEIAVKNNRNKQWYASIMLNRLMFCYFIQKKGFLDNNMNYLREKLAWVRREQGEDRFFQSFYRGFLSQLFHGGLNDPHHSQEFEDFYGRIPYLNGGMFDEHTLEQQYADIDIADEAFDNLFSFFDQWHWHLDDRHTASGKDINPDVLGYIFEQYINDRAAMGAYYTKEDITEYIGKNCILPFLMDKTKTVTKDSEKEFRPNGYVWQTLAQSGDRYIYDAVKKGYSDDWQERIPDYIAEGIDTTQPNLLERRKRWNEKTSEEFALPTEIWRETVERLKRCDDLLEKINTGSISEINDFITYNLDIRQFVYDLLFHADDHHFVAHFYHALQQVTILDPTCGSGAFLFAAMNILEPLYEVCIERMEQWHESNPNLFKDELEEIDRKYRSNRQYFIYKSIILRNLYGVDIMVEATEIAKLRLFLKMVAVVEVDMRAPNLGLDPLPDIDFNIRCGNTLVGYATEAELERDLTWGDMFANQEFKEEVELGMEKAALAFKQFKAVQFTQDEDMEQFKSAKKNLRDYLDKLNDTLNRKLYKATADEAQYFGGMGYDSWLKSHQPFHWLAEFYEIIQGNGGFDVIIGNPPYVEYNKKVDGVAVSDKYKLNGYSTIECGNLYAFVLERTKAITRKESFIGMIVPLSGHSTERMSPLVTNYYKSYNYRAILNLSADANPSRLFEGVKFRLSIFFVNNSHQGTFSSKYTRWFADERKVLFSAHLCYNAEQDYAYMNILPKVSSPLFISIATRIQNESSQYFKNIGSHNCLYNDAPVNWMRSHSFIPYFHSDRDGDIVSRHLKKMNFGSEEEADCGSAVLNSTLFYIWWICHSSCYNVNSPELFSFRLTLDKEELSSLCSLNKRLSDDMLRKSKRRVYVYKTTGRVEYDEFYMKLSKPIIDEIDKVLAKHYGFTEEELDFIINYDIKYRMGDELNDE